MQPTTHSLLNNKAHTRHPLTDLVTFVVCSCVNCHPRSHVNCQSKRQKVCKGPLFSKLIHAHMTSTRCMLPPDTVYISWHDVYKTLISQTSMLRGTRSPLIVCKSVATTVLLRFHKFDYSSFIAIGYCICSCTSILLTCDTQRWHGRILTCTMNKIFNERMKCIKCYVAVQPCKGTKLIALVLRLIILSHHED